MAGPVLHWDRLIEGELGERELAEHAQPADQVLPCGVHASGLAELARVVERLPLADAGQAQGRDRDRGHDCDDVERCDQRAATMRAHHPPPTFMDPAKTGGRMFARFFKFSGDSERVLMARRNVSGRRADRFSSAGTGSPVLSGDARVARATTTMFTLRMLAGCPV